MKAVESFILLSVCDEVIKLQLECCVARYHLIFFFFKKKLYVVDIAICGCILKLQAADGIEIFSYFSRCFISMI